MGKYFDSIVRILNDYTRPITADVLAKKLGISTKTVYRAVKEINSKLSEPLIISRRGLGYSLDLDIYAQLISHPSTSQQVTFSPVERRNQVISNIPFNAPMSKSLNNLYQSYYVSTDLIRRDLMQISHILKKYNIKLINKNGTVAAEGSEEAIRQAINGILIDSGAMSQESVGDFADQIEDINNYDRHFIITQLSWIQRALGTKIPYPYNVNIFSHLYILIKRFRIGYVQLQDYKNYDCNEVKQVITDNSNFFKIASNVIKNISDYLHYQLPEVEKYNLLQYLISMRYVHDLAFKGQVPALVTQIVDYYIEYLDLDPQEKSVKVLRNDLIGHIKPMLNRLNNRIVVFNKLLQDIKTEYHQLFLKIKRASCAVERKFQLKNHISDDEIGFITLYFANYFENRSRFINTLIMCASGIGTSKLLYAKIHKAFPNLNIISVISKVEYEKNPEKYLDIDLIITTVDVQPKNHAKVIISSAIFSKTDRQRLEGVINYF